MSAFGKRKVRHFQQTMTDSLKSKLEESKLCLSLAENSDNETAVILINQAVKLNEEIDILLAEIEKRNTNARKPRRNLARRSKKSVAASVS